MKTRPLQSRFQEEEEFPRNTIMTLYMYLTKTYDMPTHQNSGGKENAILSRTLSEQKT